MSEEKYLYGHAGYVTIDQLKEDVKSLLPSGTRYYVFLVTHPSSELYSRDHLFLAWMNKKEKIPRRAKMLEECRVA